MRNFRENSLKRDLSNDTTVSLPLFSLVNTFNIVFMILFERKSDPQVEKMFLQQATPFLFSSSQVTRCHPGGLLVGQTSLSNPSPKSVGEPTCTSTAVSALGFCEQLSRFGMALLLYDEKSTNEL
jgi:hypothetical protein